jgi:single-stranded DNA-binding protein
VIAALLQGTLAGDPVRRTSAKGQPFATAQVRVPVGSESVYIGVTVFGETEIERLCRLAKGASVAAAGELQLNVWVDREGQDRRDWRLLAHEVLTVHQARRRREREEAAS